MKGGALEVLLVSAEGLRVANRLGSFNQYVELQCGNQTLKSKISPGKSGQVRWNEKLCFKLPSSEWKNPSLLLKLAIMEKDRLVDDCLLGEAKVHVDAVVKEGISSKSGSFEVKPAPYNVVLQDGTFKGQIKVGLKFIANVEIMEATPREGGGVAGDGRGGGRPAARLPLSSFLVIVDFLSRWWRRLFSLKKTAP